MVSGQSHVLTVVLSCNGHCGSWKYALLGCHVQQMTIYTIVVYKLVAVTTTGESFGQLAKLIGF